MGVNSWWGLENGVEIGSRDKASFSRMGRDLCRPFPSRLQMSLTWAGCFWKKKKSEHENSWLYFSLAPSALALARGPGSGASHIPVAPLIVWWADNGGIHCMTSDDSPFWQWQQEHRRCGYLPCPQHQTLAGLTQTWVCLASRISSLCPGIGSRCRTSSYGEAWGRHGRFPSLRERRVLRKVALAQACGCAFLGSWRTGEQAMGGRGCGLYLPYPLMVMLQCKGCFTTNLLPRATCSTPSRRQGRD